ncbi:MAG: SDR family oxidoreductase [Gammaproteobacteria bacterium]|nr:SDR family oxidoreductase [Gammaproteobacteria bacterium]
MDQTRLRGKRAIITGAGSGIGRAAAIRFAREGARVAAVDVNERGVKETVSLISGSEALALVADVTKEDQVERAVKDAVKAFGGLDIVISNAGIAMVGKDDRVDRIALEVWQRMLDVNHTGMFLTCKHGIRALLASGGGAVVCTTSPTGLYGIAPEQTAYSASKAGVYGLVRSMAAAYGKEMIRVNGVMPGYIKTALTSWVTEEHEREFSKMVPIGRAGVPEEIASVMAFLASDEASYVTGAVYVADGGWTAI